MADGSPAPAAPVGRVLIVDDEPALLRALARTLMQAGHDVASAGSGAEAVALLDRDHFDAVLSDIGMPEMDGFELLRAVRQRSVDLDLPVILMTGGPSLETAVKAVEYGALRYLMKPIDNDLLMKSVSDAVRLGQLAKLKRQAFAATGSDHHELGDKASLEGRFQRALDALWMAFQPIVRWPARNIFAYEALVRTREPTIPHPGALFGAAERLDRLPILGRRIRDSVAEVVRDAPPGVDIFVNVHTQDLVDPHLFDPGSRLSGVAARVVLEITERASLERVKDVADRIARLRSLGFRIAIDDLGAGYAGLTSFAQLQPEIVKLDMTLTRGVDLDRTRQKLIGSLAALCHDMGMLVVTEGIETEGERDAVVALGCELLQGYLFAKPSPPFCDVRW
jgi:EAL domain-containing protein (putative c-di-GMP-specific phosphodiesterase class I)/ActR/RegA family two-component response regulator